MPSIRLELDLGTAPMETELNGVGVLNIYTEVALQAYKNVLKLLSVVK